MLGFLKKGSNISKNDVEMIVGEIMDYFEDFSCFQGFKDGENFQKVLFQNSILFSREYNKVLHIVQPISKLSFADTKWLCYSLFNENYFHTDTCFDKNNHFTLSANSQNHLIKKHVFYFLFLDIVFSLLIESKKKNSVVFDEPLNNYKHLTSLFEKELFDIVESDMLKAYFDILMNRTMFKMLKLFQAKNGIYDFDILDGFCHIFENTFLNKFNAYSNLWFCHFSFSNDDYLNYLDKKLDKNIFPKDDNKLPSSKDLVRTKSFFEKSQKYKFEINEFLHFDNLKIIKDAMNHLFYHFDFLKTEKESFYCFSDSDFVKKFKKHYTKDVIWFFKQIIYSDVMDFLTSFEDKSENKNKQNIYVSYFLKSNCKICFSNYREVFLKSIKNFYLNYGELREHFYFSDSLLNLFKLKSEDEDRINGFINLLNVFDFDKELNKNLDEILYFNNHKDLTHIEISFETLLFTIFYYDNNKMASRFISKSTLDKFLNVMENYLQFSFNFYLSEVFSNEDLDNHFNQTGCTMWKTVYLQNSPNYEPNTDYNSETLRSLISHKKQFEENVTNINVVLYDCIDYLKYNTKDSKEVKSILYKLMTIFNFWKIKDNDLFFYNDLTNRYGFKNLHFEVFLSLIVQLNNLFNIKLHSKNAFLFMFYHLFLKSNNELSSNFVFSKKLSLFAFKDEQLMFNDENRKIIDFLDNYSSSFIPTQGFDIYAYGKMDKCLERHKNKMPLGVYNFIRNMFFELQLNFFG